MCVHVGMCVRVWAGNRAKKPLVDGWLNFLKS